MVLGQAETRLGQVSNLGVVPWARASVTPRGACAVVVDSVHEPHSSPRLPSTPFHSTLVDEGRPSQ